MMGYGEEEQKITVLELTYNYGVTEYTKGTGYAQVRCWICCFLRMAGLCEYFPVVNM